MKTLISTLVTLVVYSAAICPGRADSEFHISESGADYAVWTRAPSQAKDAGGTNGIVPGGRYVELETGARYFEEGQWRDSDETIDIVEGGAVARRLPYKVWFPSSLASVNSSESGSGVEVLTADNKRIQVRPLGLAYYDFIAKSYVNFAEVKGSEGQLVSSNVVVYPDAMEGGGVVCDIRYTVRKSGIEQDFIFKRAPRALPEAFKFNPISTRVLAMTEFISPSLDTRTVQHVRRGWKESKVDRIIDFGTMKIGHGAAFLMGQEKSPRVPVEKSWQVIDGRQILIEEVSFRRMAPLLSKLQASTRPAGMSNSRLALGSPTKNLCLPSPTRLAGKPSNRPMELAALKYATEPGVVIDFDLQSCSGLKLQSDTTYVVAGTVNLTNAVIEGGSVLKFRRGARLNFFSPPECRTGPFRESVFTAVDDDSVGEIIAGSTGTPTGRYAQRALSLSVGGELKYLRILHAEEAIYCASSDYSVWHSQILSSDIGLHTDSATFFAGNVLMNKVLINFYGIGFFGQAQHLTSHEANTVVWDPNFEYDDWCHGLPSSEVGIVNSILVSLTNGVGIESTVLSYVDQYSTASQVFTVAAGGRHYLQETSPSRDSGTAGIDPGLAAALLTKTTTAPLIYQDADIPAGVYGRRQLRDAALDKGYYYDCLDYVFAGCDAVGNVTFGPGTAVGWYRLSSGWQQEGHGIHIEDGYVLTFDGKAEAPCYWVRCSTVQELDLSGGYGPGGITGWAWPDIANSAQIEARFTRFAAMAMDSSHYRDDWGWLVVRANHCEFYGGAAGGYNNRYSYTNCLFDRVVLSMNTDWPDSGFTMRNCTMNGGALDPNRFNAGASVPVVIRECAFDATDIRRTSGLNTSFDLNASLLSAPTRVLPAGAGDMRIATFNWQGSPGTFYLPTNSWLVNTSTVTANVLGLYHFTTHTNQTKEAVSRLDCGYHYVARDSQGRPMDTDGDGMPDYWEDRNGNGTADAEETGWLTYNSPNGLTNGNSLQIFTPLKR